jgi:hypothetical protein
MEERRRDHLDFHELRSDVKLLLVNQADIKKQVEKTNGRVAALEIWKAFLGGGMAVILVLIVPVVIYIVQQYIGGK